MANTQVPNQPIEQTTDQLETIHIEDQPSPLLSLSDYSHEGNNSISSSVYCDTHRRTNGGEPFWTHRVSTSFSAMADQIAVASHAIIAQIPPLPDVQFVQLESRIEEIADMQATLQSELEELRHQLRAITDGPEKLQRQLHDHIAEFKLEQQRLPARLHNALITVSKAVIKLVVDKSGKIPAQFPATRGEFEHLMKELYEGLMKAYGIPVLGDVHAKRSSVRSFIGLPQVQ